MGFGDFDSLCKQAAVPLCSVVGHITHIAGSHGLEAECYARNIELANTIIFQGAASFMHIAALIMTVIMILHVRSKFTAVGGLPKPEIPCMENVETNDTINRSQGNYVLLLHLHDALVCVADSRFWRCSSWK